MVIQGHPTTLPVELSHALYHTRCVVAGSTRPLVITDLPFGTYQAGPEDAFRASAAALQAGAQMVKIEGGEWIARTVELSGVADLIATAARKLAAEPAVDQARVQEIRKAITSGSYTVDPERIARKLIDADSQY